jgi:hypothetical protein
VYRGLGSIAFVAACRFAMLVARDPLVPGRCVLAQVRTSLAGPQESPSYQLTAADGALPSVDWLGRSPTSADQLLAGGARGDQGPRDRAAAFLEQFLAGGPRTARDIWEAAQKADLPARTLNRAKRGLGIRSRRVQVEGRPVSHWLLAGQELPAGLSDTQEIDRMLANLERRFPPLTPLEEDDFDDELG